MSLQSTPEAFALCSRNQRDAISTALQHTSYDVDAASRLVDAVRSAGFAAADEQALMQDVQQHVHTEFTVQKRVPLQDYKSIMHFGTETFWENMQEPSTAQASLTRFVHDLGLRNPSEPTYQRLTALLLMSTEGMERARCMQPAVLYEAYLAVKRCFKALPKVAQPFRIKDLPATPLELKRSTPLLWKALYNEESPTECPFSATDVEWLTELIPMRRTPKLNANPYAMQQYTPAMPQQQPMQPMLQLQQLLGLFANGSHLNTGPRIDIFSPPQRKAPQGRDPLQDQASTSTNASTSTDVKIEMGEGAAAKTPMDAAAQHDIVPKSAADASKAVLAAIAGRNHVSGYGDNAEPIEKKDKKMGNKMGNKDKKGKIAKTSPTKKTKTATKSKVEVAVMARPSVKEEPTRNQYKAWTGVKGTNQYKTVKYSKTKSKAKAKDECIAWLKATHGMKVDV